MPLLTVLQYPDQRLRQCAQPVETIDASIRRIIDDMFDTMYQAPGIGLAAIQVNIDKQIIVIDISEEKKEPYCLINPEIVASSGDSMIEEGCLSVPGFFETVHRFNEITVKALDKHGTAFELETEGLLSVCIQHEIDHLKGKLFVDYLSELKRHRIRKKLEKQKQRAG